jgi:membrane-bound lytic murein transglycosylase D
LQRPEEFDIVWKFIANEPKIAVVDVGNQVDLSVAAELAGISVADLQALNPGFSQWATAPGGPHQLVLPVDKAEHFSAQLAQLPVDKLMQWQPYQVKSGDTLGAIAKRHQISVSDLQRLNKLNGNIIRIGQNLLIPRAGEASQQLAQRPATVAMTPATGTEIVHLVQRGDTLWDLSRKFDVTVAQLRSWNKLSASASLREGQKLSIFSTAASELAAQTRTLNYRVRPGDSLAKIAQRFSVTVADIVKWNNINTERYLQPGQQLKLLVDASAV